MRVNLDDPDNDPRVRYLARLLGLPILHAVGVLYGVWRTAYSRRSAFLSEQEIDIAGETTGLAEKMVTAALAKRCGGRVEQGSGKGFQANPSNLVQGRGNTQVEADPSGPLADPTMLRISGIEDRIEFLRNASEKGKLGGIRSAEARRKARDRSTRTEPLPNPGQTLKGFEPSYSGSFSGSGSERSGGVRSRSSGSGAGKNPEPEPAALPPQPHIFPDGSARDPDGGTYPDPTTLAGIAQEEAHCIARGVPIPWRYDRRRWAMTHDVLGDPVPRMGPPNGAH